MGSKIMSYTVQFQFIIMDINYDDEDEAKEAAVNIAKKTFGDILFKELTDPEAFQD
jgi:hypothetical protein